MPLFKIHTNLSLSEAQTNQLLTAMTDLVVKEMNKPREYVQTWLESGCTLQLAGSGDPSAFVELRALDLSPNQAKPLSASIAAFLEKKLSIPPGRVFINFVDVPRAMWGWNGSTFG